MEYNDDTPISKVDSKNMTREEYSALFKSPFDGTAHDLIHSLQAAGVTQEQYDTLVEQVEYLIDATASLFGHMGDQKDYDPTVKEYQPVALLTDLAICGILIHTMHANREAVTQQLGEKLFGSSDMVSAVMGMMGPAPEEKSE